MVRDKEWKVIGWVVKAVVRIEDNEVNAYISVPSRDSWHERN